MADVVLKLTYGDTFRVERDASTADAGLYINGTKVLDGQFATAIANYDITWTANEPTAGDTATIANGNSPTVAETGQAIADLTAKLNLVIDALSANGLITES